MQPTLLILAAGMASRYGSMKQIQQFGPGGETIMDYSIYDAIRAGFGKVVFIIREDFAADFKDIFESRLKSRIATDYVYQDLHAFVNGFEVPSERTKPWGTAHAVLCAQDVIREPFAVINADDFYGRDAFEKMAAFLKQDCSDHHYGVVGYELSKTVSEFGSVSRGVCEVDARGHLASITERTKIYRHNGQLVFEENDRKHLLSDQTPVSMNFWGFHPTIFGLTEKLFYSFLEENISDPKAEFFIPIVVDHFINQQKGTVKVLHTRAQWFGVTYKEDAPGVKNSLDQLVAKGVYPSSLWNSC